MPLGISKYVKSAQALGDPTVIGDLVGWWDFTRPEWMEQKAVDGTVVTADGQYIGSIKNLAPGDSNGDKLGQTLRCRKDDTGNEAQWQAVYKTGGAGGRSYALFPSSSDCGYAAGVFTNYDSGEDALNWGGVSATKLSDLVMTSHNMTTFIVEQIGAASLSASRTLYNMHGNTSPSSSVNNEMTTSKTSSELYTSLLTQAGATGSPELVATGAYANTDLRCIMTVGDNTGSIYINGSQIDTEVFNTNFVYDFGTTSTSGSVPNAAVSIGVNLPNIALEASNFGANNYYGKIYEVLHFAKTLDSDEISLMETYLSQKYSLTFS